MADPKETGIPQTPDAQRKLLENLFKPEAGGRLGVADLSAAMTRLFGDRAREAAKPQDRELAPDVEKRLRVSFEKNMAMLGARVFFASSYRNPSRVIFWDWNGFHKPKNSSKSVPGHRFLCERL